MYVMYLTLVALRLLVNVGTFVSDVVYKSLTYLLDQCLLLLDVINSNIRLHH